MAVLHFPPFLAERASPPRGDVLRERRSKTKEVVLVKAAGAFKVCFRFPLMLRLFLLSESRRLMFPYSISVVIRGFKDFDWISYHFVAFTVVVQLELKSSNCTASQSFFVSHCISSFMKNGL